MSEVIGYRARKESLQSKENRSMVAWLLLFGAGLFVTLALSYSMVRNGPDPALLGWFIYLAGAAAILYRPRWGVYLILFFALIGDGLLMPWYPFVKNFSSAESLFYVSKSLIFNPMETYIVLTFLSWLGRALPMRKVHFQKGDVLVPATIFLLFVIFGLGYGIARGGSLNIALWEVRPFFYLYTMFLLSTNLLSQREHYRYLFMWASAALVIEGIAGTCFYIFGLQGSLAGVEAITEHSAAIHINTVFVLLLAAWLYRSSPLKWTGLLAGLPFLLITYIADQRRAAIVSLAVAIAIFAFILYFENRRGFWLIVPTVGMVGLIYIAAFWNSSGALGMPAQAIKSVVAQDSSSVRNQSSNIYRVLENIDTGFTIHQHPLTGVGFGNVFYLLVPLPDISFFLWWNYLPHNSIIYVWVKTGAGGFLAMLFFIGTAIVTGARVVMRTRDREAKTFLLTGLIYIMMHFLYAYVDISWDARSMLYMGAIVGMLNSAEFVLSIPGVPKKKRYPWQPEPTALPGLYHYEEK